MKMRFLLALTVYFLTVDALQSAPPATLSYQSRLLNASGARVNGTVNITFRIYDALTGGTKLWEETLTGVTVTDGIFSVILGKSTSLANLAFDKTYYTSMEVGTDGEMSPRLEMASAPYAMNANKIESVMSIDKTNKRIGIGLTNPQSVFEILPTQIAGGVGQYQNFSVAAQSGLGSHVRNRLLMANAEPGIHLSSDYDDASNTQTGSEKSLLGLQIGVTYPVYPSGQQARGLYNQLFFGGSPFIVVQATPNAEGGYPNERLRIDTNGNVGIGGVIPKKLLHVAGDAYFKGSVSIGPSYGAENNWGFVGEAGHLTWASDNYLHLSSNASNGYGLVLGPNDDYAHQITIKLDGSVGIGTHNPTYPLHMASGAYVTAGGVWTNASSRELKQDIKNLSLESALSTLEQMNPVTFAYKNEPEDKHVGFIAEDVPELVATKDRKGLSPMDTLAVLTKVVQNQQKTIKEQNKTINELKSMLQQTLAGLSSIQKQVNHLEINQGRPVLHPASFTVNQ